MRLLCLENSFGFAILLCCAGHPDLCVLQASLSLGDLSTKGNTHNFLMSSAAMFYAGVPNPEDSAHRGDGVGMDYDPKLDVKPSPRKPAKSKSAVGSAAHAAEVEEGRAIKVHCKVLGLGCNAPPGSLLTEPACIRGTGYGPQVHQGAVNWDLVVCVSVLCWGCCLPAVGASFPCCIRTRPLTRAEG